jgi:hypothetical protein
LQIAQGKIMKVSTPPNRQAFLVLLIAAVFSTPLAATELIWKPGNPAPLNSAAPKVQAIPSPDGLEANPEGDTYSLAPLVQDSELAYFMSEAGTATSHRFDEERKSGGENIYGSPGGTFSVIEEIIDLGDGVEQIGVQVTALSAQGNPEPWVDESFAGSGLIEYRLDVGTELGGTNPIEPDSPFTLLNSGFSIFDSEGDFLAEFELKDFSDSKGLAGVAVLGRVGDEDIAGLDMATMIMFWNIKKEPVGSGFMIDAGLNGNWWNGLDRNGEGVQVEVSDGGDGSLILVATIYSYDSMGNQIFLIAVGTANGDTAEVEVFITEGGQWGDNYDPALVTESQWGTGTFTASSCDAMHMALVPSAEFQAAGYTALMYDLMRLTTPAAPCPIDNPN